MLDLVNLLATMQRALSFAACALLLAFAAAPFVTVITLSYAFGVPECRIAASMHFHRSSRQQLQGVIAGKLA